MAPRNVPPRWPIGASPADAGGTPISVAARAATKTTWQRRLSSPPGRPLSPSHDSTRRRLGRLFLTGPQRFQHRSQIRFDAVLVDARPVQRTAAVFQFEQCEQQMLGADVVVAQAKCLAEGQLEHFACRTAEWDQVRGGG